MCSTLTNYSFVTCDAITFFVLINCFISAIKFQMTVICLPSLTSPVFTSTFCTYLVSLSTTVSIFIYDALKFIFECIFISSIMIVNFSNVILMTIAWLLQLIAIERNSSTSCSIIWKIIIVFIIVAFIYNNAPTIVLQHAIFCSHLLVLYEDII